MDKTIRSQRSRMERQRRTLETKIRALQRKELAALPSQVGLASIDTLILALIEYASPAMRARLEPRAASAGNIKPALAEARSRAKFSPELRERIRKDLEVGQKSVAELSRQYGPSHPTIMGWKREWGLTRPRPHQRRRHESQVDDSHG